MSHVARDLAVAREDLDNLAAHKTPVVLHEHVVVVADQVSPFGHFAADIAERGVNPGASSIQNQGGPVFHPGIAVFALAQAVDRLTEKSSPVHLPANPRQRVRLFKRHAGHGREAVRNEFRRKDAIRIAAQHHECHRGYLRLWNARPAFKPCPGLGVDVLTPMCGLLVDKNAWCCPS